MISLLPIRLDDLQLEIVRRNHHDAIAELQKLPASSVTVLRDVVLADGVETPLAHGLGRPVVWVKESCVRGASTAGAVLEVRDNGLDRSKFVTLKAISWGATITVDVVVM